MLLGRQLHDLESFPLHQSWEEAEEVSVDRGIEQRIATQRRNSAAQIVKPIPRDRAGERVKEPAPSPVGEWFPSPHSCRERCIGALLYSLDETGKVLSFDTAVGREHQQEVVLGFICSHPGQHRGPGGLGQSQHSYRFTALSQDVRLIRLGRMGWRRDEEEFGIQARGAERLQIFLV
jgi:hypothetical protein